MSLHIYVSRMQPATRVRYGSELGIKPFWLRRSPRSLIRCHSCHRLRWASKVGVQVYYDGDYQSCRDRDECKAWQKKERRRLRIAKEKRKVLKQSLGAVASTCERVATSGTQGDIYGRRDDE